MTRAATALRSQLDARAAAPEDTAAELVSAMCVDGIVSATDFGQFQSAAPGVWIEIYGERLSDVTHSREFSDFPGFHVAVSLGGVSVTIGGKAAFVSYVSPGQVNALVPWNVEAGLQQVVIANGAGARAEYMLRVHDLQPALLAPQAFRIAGLQFATALFPDGAYAGPPIPEASIPLRRARPGDRVTFYGIGFGPEPCLLSSGLRFFFGQAEAEVIYAGFASGFAGLYQFEVAVPEMEGGDAIPLSFTLDGAAGQQALHIAVQKDENALAPFAELNIQVSPGESDAHIPMHGIGGITVVGTDDGLLGAISGTLLDRKGFSDWWYGSAWKDVQIDGHTVVFRELDFLNSVMRNSADDMVRIESAFLCVVLIPGANPARGKVSGALRLVSKVGTVEGAFTGIYTLN